MSRSSCGGSLSSVVSVLLEERSLLDELDRVVMSICVVHQHFRLLLSWGHTVEWSCRCSSVPAIGVVLSFRGGEDDLIFRTSGMVGFVFVLLLGFACSPRVSWLSIIMGGCGESLVVVFLARSGDVLC
jgi:hypothetical protein